MTGFVSALQQHGFHNPSMVHAISCSVVIVNWNSLAVLRECLDSIQRTMEQDLTEVIVLDNASYDGSADACRTSYPWVRFVQLRRNLGFSRANNVGASCASGELVLFLNPDTEVLGDSIGTMAKVLLDHPRVGALGCRILNTDRSVQTSCVLPFPTILNQTLSLQPLVRLTSGLRLWGISALSSADPGLHYVDAVSGACLMVKRFVFEKVAGFSERYFMYSEDVDLCHKIRDAGWKVVYSPLAQVVHHGGAASSQRGVSRFGPVLHQESLFVYLRKFRGPIYALVYRVSAALGALCRIMLLILIVPVSLRQHTMAAIASFRKWRYVFSWALGMEKWARTIGQYSDDAEE